MIVIGGGLVLAALENPWADSPFIAWHNIVTATNVVADGEDADYPASNLGNDNEASIWRGEDDAEQYLTVTTGYVGEIDYVAIDGHNFGSGNIPVSIEILDEEGGDWVEVVGDFIPSSDAPIIFWFDAQSAYQIRVRMQSGDEIPEAAVLYAGLGLRVPNGIPPGFTPTPFARKTDVVGNRAEGGKFLGRIVTRTTIVGSVSFQYLDKDWYREHFDPFVVAARERPFFFAWAPSSYPDEVGFCNLKGDPKPVTLAGHGEMNVTIEYEATSVV